MREIVIISGKGGTGKTSITASFAALASGTAVLADCDVDAADLHIILRPDFKTKTAYRSGHKAVIRQSDCVRCGGCLSWCRFDAIRHDGKGAGESPFTVDPLACEGCGVCVRFCPAKAMDFPEQTCGEWYVSETRFGAMVHARLGIAAENSGKLVTLVRNEARKIADERGADYVLVDGSPGLGCPVIASVTAADLALIVTEPTVSGEHDLRRVAQLAQRLGTPAMVCVNKWDINPGITAGIEDFTRSEGIGLAGRVRYDTSSTEAQRAGETIVEHCRDGLVTDIRGVWNALVARVP